MDLSLFNDNGELLDMGTPFDAFTPLSHHGSTGVPLPAQRNRMFLLGLMTAACARATPPVGGVGCAAATTPLPSPRPRPRGP